MPPSRWIGPSDLRSACVLSCALYAFSEAHVPRPAAAAPPSPPLRGGSGSSGPQWNCKACTFANASSAKNCGACNAARPVSVSASVGAIESKAVVRPVTPPAVKPLRLHDAPPPAYQPVDLPPPAYQPVDQSPHVTPIVSGPPPAAPVAVAVMAAPAPAPAPAPTVASSAQPPSMSCFMQLSPSPTGQMVATPMMVPLGVDGHPIGPPQPIPEQMLTPQLLQTLMQSLQQQPTMAMAAAAAPAPAPVVLPRQDSDAPPTFRA
jgi:hypothetical protein